MGKRRNVDNIVDHFKVATPNYLSSLIPVTVREPIYLTRLSEPMTATQLIDMAKKKGMNVNEVPLRLFPPSKMGKPRRLDNTDLVSGYPFYGQGLKAVQNLVQARSSLQLLATFTMERLEGLNATLADMDFEDMRKLSVLRTTYFGRHLKPPISPDTQTNQVYPPDFLEILEKVLTLYSRAAPHVPPPVEAMLEGTDAVGTALGAPTFAGDEQLYHIYRVMTMAALPVPDFNRDGAEWLDAVEQMFAPIMGDGRYAYAAYLSYRQGAKVADIPLWTPSGSGFTASYTSKGMYSFMRGVYPGAYFINVALTGLYKWMNGARNNMIGMSHSPEKASVYLPLLQSQGKNPWEGDFSNYDMTITSKLMITMCDILIRRKIRIWESTLLRAYLERIVVLTPSFHGNPDTATSFDNFVTLLSGVLLTSEIGSVLSLALNLYAINRQDRSWVEAYFANKKVMLIQSDDAAFTTSFPLKQEQYAADMLELGIVIKLKPGSTFLKKILPLLPGIFDGKKETKPFSRIYQQTYGNEDNYDGKPDAIFRLGLSARCDGIQNHPLFSSVWPKVIDWLWDHYPYTRTLDRAQWLKGRFPLAEGDDAAILAYASKAGRHYMINLMERAAYDPSAAAVLAQLSALDLPLGQYRADQIRDRREVVNALMTPPTSKSFNDLLTICKWAN